jgi:hypothetical protein
MRLCCTSESIQNWSPGCGPTIGSPSSRARAPVAPAWSMCAWVSQMAFSVTPSAAMAARSLGRSPPGSMIAASIVRSHQTMEQFWAKEVTGTVW